MRRILTHFVFLAALTACAPSLLRKASPAPLAGMSAADRTRLAEAFKLAADVGDSVWQGWSSAPFAVLLVTPEKEFLIRHPRPSDDFTDAGYDPVLASHVYTRARVYQPNLLATFPAVGGIPTIVIGTAERTGKNSTAWVLTLLHEHFHQLQYSQPAYYPGVADLDLSNGDQTGMWMLNYPFPYDSARVQSRFDAFASALRASLAPHAADESARLLKAVADARDSLIAVVPEKDYRYLAFQFWQEGVARYTELAVARIAARRFKPTSDFRALPDYTTYSADAANLEREIDEGIADPRLATRHRVVVYPVGAAYARFLDWASPDWKQRYWAGFSLDPLVPLPTP